MKSSLLVVAVLFLGLTLGGCTTRVIRTDTSKVTDFSGYWNDTDSRLVAEEMIRDAVSGNWTNDFNRATGRMPTVIVGTIKNNTFEHINSDVFINDLEIALTNSGKVQFVANKDFRQEIRDERADQQSGNTEPSTISAKGHELGADFMLQGSISSVEDAVRGKYAVFYQVNLVLVDMKTNQKRWMGQKEIKKIVIRPQTRL
jgi:penicillin-binding protein activator